MIIPVRPGICTGCSDARSGPSIATVTEPEVERGGALLDLTNQLSSLVRFLVDRRRAAEF